MNPPSSTDLAWLSPMIHGHTQVVGVIGWPIEHSVSPPMHNAAFQTLGLDWCYVPLPVEPGKVSGVLQAIRTLGMRGINATVPHKQSLLSLVDELTPAARAIGAVNTVVVREDGCLGHNTDAQGFLRALRESDFEPEGCSALVLGAGGASRAVVYALVSVGAHVTVLNRTSEKARALATDFGPVNPEAYLESGALDAETVAQVATDLDLVVNTTPLGMWPHTDATVWPAGVGLPSGALFYDLVYNPRETLLMRQAKEAGSRAVDGLGMLVHQGAEAFALWTGQEPPVDIMYRACTTVLGGR